MNETGASDDELVGHWQACGEWLSARFPEVRVNSQRHFVVPDLGPSVFMLGLERAAAWIVVDMHMPFLGAVAETVQLTQLVSLNQLDREVVGVDVIGHLRVVPEDAGTCVLELRHTLVVNHLTQEWLYWYVDAMSKSATGLLAALQPAFGGERIVA